MIQNKMSYVHARYFIWSSQRLFINKILPHMWWHNDFMAVCEITIIATSSNHATFSITWGKM